MLEGKVGRITLEGINPDGGKFYLSV
jgi:hypothetical protein